jgi:hypothetical protein
MLKYVLEFTEADFLGIANKLLPEAYDIWSGQNTDQTRVPAQQFHNSWFDHWIVLKLL